MKQTTLGRIEINADDTIGILFLLQYVDGEEVVATKNHRAMLTQESGYNEALGSVDLHLVEMGYPIISEQDRQKINAVAAAVATLK